MFGLGKKKKAPFEFDLEKELREDKDRRKKLMELIDSRTIELKKLIREEPGSEHFDQYGILLHGYAALSKVINKVSKG